MKNKKAVIIILSIVLAISAIGCLASFTLLKHEVTRNTELQFVLRPDADKTKTLSVDEVPAAQAEPEESEEPEKTSPEIEYETPEDAGPGVDFAGEIKLAADGSELSYKHTEKTDSSSLDVYVDGNNNEYLYTADGHLIGFRGNSMTMDVFPELGKGEKLDEQQAERVADEFAGALFGKELFGEFKFDSIMPVNNEKGEQWMVFYSKPYEGISLAELTVQMYADGTVYNASLYNYYNTVDFDTALLGGKTAEDFGKMALDEFLDGADPESRGCHVSNVSLRHVGDRWYIKVSVEYEKPWYDVSEFDYDLGK